jgi:hypothetical protein
MESLDVSDIGEVGVSESLLYSDIVGVTEISILLVIVCDSVKENVWCILSLKLGVSEVLTLELLELEKLNKLLNDPPIVTVPEKLIGIKLAVLVFIIDFDGDPVVGLDVCEL